MSTRRLLVRAANSAASLTRLARSAPENLAVPRDDVGLDVAGESAPCACAPVRICSRPRISGSGTTTWRSKRPGRSSAGSSTSGRLVAAMTMMPVVALEAVHLDQQLVQRLLALVVATAEAGAALAADGVDSSMKMMHGAFFLACSNMSRTRAAPTPTNISTKSEPRSRRTAPSARRRWPWRAASCRCRASRPSARPSDAAAELLELGRVAQEVDQFEFFLRFVATSNVGEGDGVVRFVEHACLALCRTKGATAPAAPCIWRMKKMFISIDGSSSGRASILTLFLSRSETIHRSGGAWGDALAVGGRRLQRTPLDGHFCDTPCFTSSMNWEYSIEFWVT